MVSQLCHAFCQNKIYIKKCNSKKFFLIGIRINRILSFEIIVLSNGNSLNTFNKMNPFKLRLNRDYFMQQLIKLIVIII